MKRSIQLIFLLISIISFVSCGGSDITPPDGNGNTKPETEDPLNIVEMTGRSIGLAQIKVTPSFSSEPTSEVSEILVFQDKNDKNKLSFTFNKPSIALGQTEASTFQLSKNVYSFTLANYKPTTTTLEGDKIPTYIKNSYPQITITKVELDDFICKDGGTYNTESNMFLIKYSTMMSLYYTDDQGIPQEKPLENVGLTIEYRLEKVDL